MCEHYFSETRGIGELIFTGKYLTIILCDKKKQIWSKIIFCEIFGVFDSDPA